MMSAASSPPQLVEMICADQRRRWQSGERVLATTYLDKYPTLVNEPDCAVEVIYNEILLREETGETPRLDEYLQRFPHLVTQLRRLFEVHQAIGEDSLGPSLETSHPTRLTSARSRAALAVRPIVPGYEILGDLGRGGMGIVYQARHLALNRLVALKMIRTGVHADAEELARFHTEAEAAARVQHPHLVQIFDVGEAEGRPYLALEYVEGGNLAQKIAGTPQPPQQAARLIEILARAMHTAHQRNLIHRDLKPANVLLTADGTPKITDFGLAKRIEGEPGASATGGDTKSGTILGTPSYMAPEQASGQSKEIGPAADIYALGAILYEMLTGRPPFLGQTPLDTLLQVKLQDPVPVRRLQPKAPRDLETICQKCLHKVPTRRYGTAADLAEDLRRFQAGEPIKARPVGRVERAWLWCRRNPGRAALSASLLLVVLTLLVVGGGGYLWAKGQRDERAAAFRAGRDRATGLLEEGKWGAARAALKALPEPEDAENRRWAKEFLGDLDMLERLAELRAGRADYRDDQEFDTEMARAFRDYGIDVDALELEEAVNRIRARPEYVVRELVSAIIDWGLLRSRWKPFSPEWFHLASVGRTVDPDPWRNQLRDLQGRQDLAAIHQLAHDPNTLVQSVQDLQLLGRILAAEDSPAAAVAFLRKAQRRHPGDPWINYWLGHYLERMQPPQIVEAIGYYRAASAVRPELANQLAKALFRKGDHDESSALYRELTRSRPLNHRHWNNLAGVLVEKGEAKEALAACDEALRLRPDYLMALSNRGNALTKLRRYKEALAVYDEILRKRPDDYQVHYNRGLTLADMGRNDDALVAWEETVRLKADYPEAHFNRGILLATWKNQPEKALAAFDEAIRYRPDHVDAHLNRGVMLRELNRVEESVPSLAKVVELQPSNALAHCYLGQALISVGQFMPAMEALRKGHELGTQPGPWPHPSHRWVRAVERLVVLDARLPAVLKGDDKLRSNQERLDFAELCLNKDLNVTSVRFFTELFQARPEAAENLKASYRYNAARAAAMAGYGKTKDNPPPDESARALLRQQALDWLRADLTAWTKLVETTPKAQSTARKLFQQWQNDSALAGVRDAKGLAELPESERNAWRQLWADVDQLLAKVAEPKEPK